MLYQPSSATNHLVWPCVTDGRQQNVKRCLLRTAGPWETNLWCPTKAIQGATKKTAVSCRHSGGMRKGQLEGCYQGRSQTLWAEEEKGEKRGRTSFNPLTPLASLAKGAKESAKQQLAFTAICWDEEIKVCFPLILILRNICHHHTSSWIRRMRVFKQKGALLLLSNMYFEKTV